MPPKGVIPDPASWKKIVDTVRDVGRNRATRKARRMERRRNVSGLDVFDAELTATLSAASNHKTGATTASAKFLVADSGSPGDLMDGESFTVTNRSLDSSGLSGDYIIVVRIGSEWRPVWVDC